MNKNKIIILTCFLALAVFVMVRSNNINTEVNKLSMKESHNEDDLDELQEILGKIKPDLNNRDKYKANANNNADSSDQSSKTKENGIFIPISKKSRKDIVTIISTREKILRVKKLYGFHISDEEKLEIEDLAVLKLEGTSAIDLLYSSNGQKNQLYSKHGGVDWLKNYYAENVLNSKRNYHDMSQSANDRFPASYEDVYNEEDFSPLPPEYFEDHEEMVYPDAGMIEEFNEYP